MELRRGGIFLIFILDDEESGISILRIKDRIDIMTVAVIPQTPEYGAGVIIGIPYLMLWPLFH